MIYRPLIILTIFSTFILICLGGFVHNTGSSLACPDWPLCYGQVMPKMEGGVLIEHSHRMLATLVGVFTILIGIFTRKYTEFKKLKKTANILFIMVVLQGLLGGLTVIYKLPTIVSTSHLGLSMIFFMTLIYLFHQTSLINKRENFLLKEVKSWNLNLKHFFKIIVSLVFIQIVLGALIRHLGLGGACGTGAENSIICFDMIDWQKGFIPSSNQAQLHMLHRMLAFGIGIFTLIVGTYSFIKIKNTKTKLLILGVIFVVVSQVILGIMTVASNMEEYTTTLHLAGAAILLGLCLKTYLTLKSFELVNSLDSDHSFFSDLLSLTKPKLSGLVVFTTAFGLFLAPGEISLFTGLIAILSTACVVAGACVINCYVERDLDKLMKRTAERPLPQKRINPKIALFFGAMLLVINIPLLSYIVNPLTGMLGLLAAVIYILLYTPLKRISTIALFVGAVPGAIPPLMGWTSVSNNIDSMGLVLFGILFLWQLPHFLAIAIFYAKDYAAANIKVVPNSCGNYQTKIRIVFYTFVLLVISLLPYSLGYKNTMYWVSTLFIGGIFFIFSVYGMMIKNEIETKKWAKQYFWGSLIYLPAVLVVLFVNK